IKLLALPVAVGLLVQTMPLSPAVRLVLILQAGMPCAFSTLILAEEYRLDRDTSVTAIATSSIAFLLTLPIWLAIWGQGVIG
ncbi:MAG: AEC family transporter, partial [Cyanobacteria bacterium P01_E01_bin.45]